MANDCSLVCEKKQMSDVLQIKSQKLSHNFLIQTNNTCEKYPCGVNERSNDNRWTIAYTRTHRHKKTQLYSTHVSSLFLHSFTPSNTLSHIVTTNSQVVINNNQKVKRTQTNEMKKARRISFQQQLKRRKKENGL